MSEEKKYSESSSGSNESSALDSSQDIKPFDVNKLPESFQKFLEVNEIDPAIYTVADLPRYVRWNTQIEEGKRPSLDDLRRQLGTENVWCVSGRPGFFGFVGAKNRLVDTEVYKQAAVFGIDLSSAIAVGALEIQSDDQVLDTCCAPGAKLCMIANLLGDKGTGTVTGVDLSAHRLATCRSILKRYSAGGRARLFEADGTKFAVPPPSRLGQHILDTEDPPPAKKQKVQQVKPFWAPKLLRSDPQHSQRMYDKVLVDAECTHDGSISHILKYEKWGWDAFEKNFMDPNRLDTICELQRNLMNQGWNMLKADGIMVYSTCSLTIQQNEANVAWFLEHHPDAKIEKIPNIDSLDIRFAPIKSVDTSSKIQELIHNHCIRFDPLVSRTSGFFVARFRKAA